MRSDHRVDLLAAELGGMADSRCYFPNDYSQHEANDTVTGCRVACSPVMAPPPESDLEAFDHLVIDLHRLGLKFETP